MGFSMLLEELPEEVLEANLELMRKGLVLCTFGNASGFAPSEGLVVIKPSGVPYETIAAR
jgi:L-ribulose-5-phosphate 4-epimerase